MAEETPARTTEYGPGPHAAVAGSAGYFFGAVGPGASVVGDLWELLREGAAPEVVASAAVGAAVEDFAVVAETLGGIHVVMRGEARADVDVDGAVHSLSCPAVANHATFVFARPVDRICLALGSEGRSGGRLPLSGGVVPASTLVVSWSRPGVTTVSGDVPLAPPGAAGAGPEPPVAAPEAVLTTADTPESPVAAVEPPPNDPGPPLEAPEPPAAVTEADIRVSEDTILPGPPDGSTYQPADEAGDATRAVEIPGRDRPDGATSESDAGSAGATETAAGYDHLFGLTVNRTVEEAAIRTVSDAEPAPPPPPPPPPPWPALPKPPVTSASAPAEPSPARPVPPPTASRGGMIDSVPLAGTAGAPARSVVVAAPQPPPTPAADAGHDLTIQRDAHRALLDQMATGGAEAPAGPTVHAVCCARGHLNPPHLVACRVCTAAISEQPPVTVPRPVLGVLRLSTGDEIVLDRSVLLGRRPSVDRLIDGSRPHVVKLPSPGQDISRNHVEVRVDGWHVLVTDLNSTNGTVVTRPGQQPERLRPSDAAMIEPGTVVSIADEVSFTFVAT